MKVHLLTGRRNKIPHTNMGNSVVYRSCLRDPNTTNSTSAVWDANTARICKLNLPLARSHALTELWKARGLRSERPVFPNLVAEDPAEADVLEAAVLAVIAVSACTQDCAFEMIGLCCLQATWKPNRTESMIQEHNVWNWSHPDTFFRLLQAIDHSVLLYPYGLPILLPVADHGAVL